MNFQKLDEFLEKETNNLKIPGASCMVYHNGKTVYVKSTGYADIDAQKKMSQHTCLNLYSLTKVITCIAALQLYERGEYLLGEPLHKYMPEFSDMSVIKNINGREEIVPCTKEIIIKNLFTMTAGFGGNFDSPAIHRTKQKNGGTVELNEFIKEFSEEPLEFEPGEKWKYGLCHDVLAALIEVISDMKFSEYLKKIFLSLLKFPISALILKILKVISLEAYTVIIPKQKLCQRLKTIIFASSGLDTKAEAKVSFLLQVNI